MTTKTNLQSSKEDLPRSMRPPIPEPRHRVAPLGISSGISFRHLPTASFNEMRKICDHYEDKCSGTYDSLASRYVIQMAREIRCQIDCMQGMDPSTTHYIPADEVDSSSSSASSHDNKAEKHTKEVDNKTVLKRRRHNRQNTRKSYPPTGSRPKTAGESSSYYHRGAYVTSLQEQNRKLKKELLTIKNDMKKMQSTSEKRMSEQQDVYEEKVRRALDEEQQKTQSQVSQVKNDARVVIDFIRRKADEFIAESDVKHDAQMKEMVNKMNVLERKMKARFHDQLQKLEAKFKFAVQGEQAKVNDYHPSPKPTRQKQVSLSPPRQRESRPSSSRSPLSPISPHSNKSPVSHDTASERYETSLFQTKDLRRDTKWIFDKDENDNKRRSSIDECIWLRSRVSELEQWSETLVKALQDGVKLKGIHGQFYTYEEDDDTDKEKSDILPRSKGLKVDQKGTKIDRVMPSHPRNKKQASTKSHWR